MSKILDLITLNIKFNDNTSFRHLILISGVLIIILFFFSFFAVFNYLILERTTVALLNISAALITLFILYYLKKSKNIQLAAKLSTLNLILFLFLFIYTVGSAHFSLIWTIFLPIFAIFANGKRIGLYFSILFYTILFTLSYKAIGIWDNGNWQFLDWIRLVSASTLLTFGMYLNESAYEEYERQLKLFRRNEQKLMQELSKQSVTDQLTQLYNRRYYDTLIEKLIANTKRNKECITFFILDIDYFKKYNDKYGHKKGDYALIQVAQKLKEHIQRGNDFTFRLGGEEFAGILISNDKQKTQDWIAKLCELIEELQIEHEHSHLSPYLTVSIGVSSKCYNEEFNAESLYLEADQALYAAKSHGRNRCEVAA